MFNMNQMSVSVFSKVSLLLGGWGLLLIAGGAINQWVGLDADATLMMWGAVTVLGIAVQLVSMVRGLGMNLAAWLIVLVLGWAFTFYLFKLDNGAHPDLFSDLPTVWLVLLGFGYVATAFQVDKRFFIIAAVNLLVGVLMDLSLRQIITIQFLNDYMALVVGVVSGLPLIIAALPIWYSNKATTSQPVATSAQSAR